MTRPSSWVVRLPLTPTRVVISEHSLRRRKPSSVHSHFDKTSRACSIDSLLMGLPQELIDCIVDFLCYSPPTLIACSLVSSSWTNSAHRYLFHKLIFVRRGSTEPNYPSLLRFLENTPSIAKHVRILERRGLFQIKSLWG